MKYCCNAGGWGWGKDKKIKLNGHKVWFRWEIEEDGEIEEDRRKVDDFYPSGRWWSYIKCIGGGRWFVHSAHSTPTPLRTTTRRALPWWFQYGPSYCVLASTSLPFHPVWRHPPFSLSLSFDINLCCISCFNGAYPLDIVTYNIYKI